MVARIISTAVGSGLIAHPTLLATPGRTTNVARQPEVTLRFGFGQPRRSPAAVRITASSRNSGVSLRHLDKWPFLIERHSPFLGHRPVGADSHAVGIEASPIASLADLMIIVGRPAIGDELCGGPVRHQQQAQFPAQSPSGLRRLID